MGRRKDSRHYDGDCCHQAHICNTQTWQVRLLGIRLIALNLHTVSFNIQSFLVFMCKNAGRFCRAPTFEHLLKLSIKIAFISFKNNISADKMQLSSINFNHTFSLSPGQSANLCKITVHLEKIEHIYNFERKLSKHILA